MSQNQIMKYGDFQFGDLTQTDIQVIHETIAKDCTEPQFRLFMTIAKSLGANPILNEIYPTVIQGKLTPQFGIGFYVSQARKHSDYKGYDVQLVYENDVFKMHQERDEEDDGRYYVVIDEHSWTFPRGKIIGCYAFAYRQGFKPFSVIMGFEEVEHYQRSAIGMQKTMWTNQLPDMFKKHVAKRALNAAFGLSLDEDTPAEGSGGNVPPYQSPERKDITEEANAATPQQTENPPTNPTTPPEDDATKLKRARAQVKSRLAELGLTEPDQISEYITKHANPKGDKLTLGECTGLLKIIDIHIAEKAATSEDDALTPVE